MAPYWIVEVMLMQKIKCTIWDNYVIHRFENNAMVRQKAMQELLISMKKFSDELGYTGTVTERDKCSLKTNPRFQIHVYFRWMHCTTNEVIPQQYRVAESSSVHHQKPMCYVTKAILQNPRFTTQVHTKHNQPRYTVYNLNWNKKQAGLTKSKHRIALSKAASYHKANHWS